MRARTHQTPSSTSVWMRTVMFFSKRPNQRQSLKMIVEKMRTLTQILRFVCVNTGGIRTKRQANALSKNQFLSRFTMISLMRLRPLLMKK